MNKEQLVAAIILKLEAAKASIVDQWHNPQGTNTKHFIVENLLPVEVCQCIYDAFPKDAMGFATLKTFREKKRTLAKLSDQHPLLAAMTYAMQEPLIVNKIAALVGLEKIKPDPTLYAGGVSMMFKGDFLNPHIDNSHDAERKQYRRLNLLYYVSPDWSVENGGNFELWNDTQTIQKTIVSAFNRLVVMNTDRASWHSVSPVQVEHPRCCVSNYYFSEISPDEADYFHVTSFTGRPEEPIKRTFGALDNALRNAVAKTFKVGRGKVLANKVE